MLHRKLSGLIQTLFSMRQPLLSFEQQLPVWRVGGQKLPAADRFEQKIRLQGH